MSARRCTREKSSGRAACVSGRLSAVAESSQADICHSMWVKMCLASRSGAILWTKRPYGSTSCSACRRASSWESFPLQGGKFPHAAQHALLRAAVQQDAFSLGEGAAEQKQGALLDAAGLLGGLDWKVGFTALLVGQTQPLQRADKALRRGVGQADHRPQLHQRLVKGARRRRVGSTGSRSWRKASLVAGSAMSSAASQHPGQHPQDVAVHRGHRQVEGDGGDGAGGVVADAGQLFKQVVAGGQLAAVGAAQSPALPFAGCAPGCNSPAPPRA